MERKAKRLITIISVLILIPAWLNGQCDTDAFLDKCASNLGSFNYIKSFTVQANPRKKERSESKFIFSKGSSYLMIPCQSDPESKMVITLYDKDHNLIASSYDETTKKQYPVLKYPCSSAGVYYIKATFKGKRNGCGICIVGFSRDSTVLN
jgi:hypothetical protein